MAHDAARLERRVAEALASASASRDGRVFVGFSGGVDSTALLLAARAASEVPVVALHFNHRLRAEAAAWASHCEALCDRLGVDVVVGVAQADLAGMGGNLEAQARRARYAFFAEQVAAGDVLLLAHHADDQAETILLRLFSGRGLIGMLEVARVQGMRVSRPFLGERREALVRYVADAGVPWIEDPSNADRTLDRNFIRHELLPLVSERWPGLVDSLARVLRSRAAVDAALESTLAGLGNDIACSLLPVAQAARIAWLRAYLATREERRVSDRGLAAFLRDIELAEVDHATLALDSGTLYAYDERIYYEPRFELPHAQTEVWLDPPAAETTLGGWRLRLRPATSADRTTFAAREAIVVRPRHGGEVLPTPAGTRAVKQLLQEARVPPWRRAGYPLVYAGENLVCVPGIAALVPAPDGEAYAVSVEWVE